jgi:FKBP-type peptidyl-prolyl cis-trans isomerases 1
MMLSRLMRRALVPVVCVAVAACSDSTQPAAPSDPAKETYAASLGVDLAQMTKVTPDLYSQDVTVGTGPTIAAGDSIAFTYSGWFVNGTLFDSNVGSAPAEVRLLQGNLIDGWVLGVPGVKVGGKRRLVIGSDLAYGAAGARDPNTGRFIIPPNTTLVFDVTIVAKR